MVDQTAPPAAEPQQQNGSPITNDAGAAAAAASSLPSDSTRPAAEHGESPQWSWEYSESSTDGSSRLKWLGGVGGALLLIAGVGGFIFARRRRRASRREQALQAARESAMAAMAQAGSLGGLSGMRRRLSGLLPGRSAVEGAIEQRAQRAGKMARDARTSARKKLSH